MVGWIRRLLDRATSPDSTRAKSLLFFPRTDAGARVTHENALAHAAVWACVRVIAESISQLPWRCFKRTDRGNEVLDTHPADRLLYSAPNELLTPAVWKELVMHDVLTWGNSYHEIVFDASYRPTSLNRVSPDRVEPMLVNGKLWYRVKNQDIADAYLEDWEMFHVRGLGDDLAGWSVIQYAAQSIGLGMAQDQSMASLIANGSRPAGILTPAGNLTKDAAARIVDEWEATYGGSKNKGKTALLSQAMNYTPMALPNTDAQMLESRKFSVVEICRFFRVPPHKVMDLERATFSNIEHQAIEFVQDTLVPWGVKLEQEANRKLISPVLRGTVFTKINFNALLRGDFQSRARGYQLLFDRGVYSINDILELEDRNTIGPDGDMRVVPMNMQTLEQLAEGPPDPQPEPPPQMPAEENVSPDDQPPTQQDAARIYWPVMHDAIDRITARECKLLAGCKTPDKLGQGHAKYIIDQLSPHVTAMAAFTGRTMDLSTWADERCHKLRSEFIGHMSAGGDLSELFSMWVDRVPLATNDILGVQNAAV